MTFVARIPRILVRISAALALLAALGIAASPARADMNPMGFQATGGWYTDNGDFFVGAGARFGIATFTIIPNAEWVMIDGGNAYTLSLDGTMNVLPLGIATGYIGAGIGLYIISPDNGDSNTNSTVNLIAGAGLNGIKLKPFAQLKYVFTDGNDPLVLAFGVRF